MTLPDGRYPAVVDRIINDTVVILVEAEEVQLDLSTDNVASLADQAISEGDLLHLNIQSGDVTDIELQSDETETRRQQLRKKFNRLSERPPDRDQ